MESASTRESTQTKNKNKNIKSGEMNENNINEAWKESLMVKSISALLNEIISENSDPMKLKKMQIKTKVCSHVKSLHLLVCRVTWKEYSNIHTLKILR